MFKNDQMVQIQTVLILNFKIIIDMMINIKLNIQKKAKHILNPQNNNFFLENTHLSHKKKSPPKQLNSFRQFKAQDFIQDDKQLLFTDRAKHKQKQAHNFHKRTNSTTKKSGPIQISRSRVPSTKQSIKFNNSNTQYSKQTTGTTFSTIRKQKQSTKINKVQKNVSELIKMPKKKLYNIINNSSLGDQESLKGTIPGWAGHKIISRFGPLLTQQQKDELKNQKEVFYIGVGTGNGQDDQDGAYRWKKHEQVGFRYQLLQPLGSGAFGQVIKAFDHKNKQQIAVKIIRSKKQHMQLALNQINILMKAKQKDIQNQKNILRIKDFIVFRKHICIITELLSISLYQLLQSNSFAPVQMTYIRTFAIQILNALAYLKQIKVVHSDLKPENVMLKNKSKTGIKLIDFGTSMFSNETNFLYIQSRFYRAPQVILGANYSYQIDMWSFGCLLAELYLGEPIFAGSNQQQQLTLIMECIGAPEDHEYLKKCKNLDRYFKSDFSPILTKSNNGKIIQPLSKQLLLLIQDKSFCQYLSKILVFNPKDRYTPLQALLDPWILQALPLQIKQQHLSFIKQKLKQQKKCEQKHKKQKTKTTHRRQHTADINKKNKEHIKKQEDEHVTIKKHSRRNSDFKMEQFNAKEQHQKHRRRGSAGVF